MAPPNASDEIDFPAWRAALRHSLQAGTSTGVPCDGCTACCRSHQFVLIEPDERATLERVDPRLLAPAPGRPAGWRVMGFDGDGRCPMLGDAGCTIYEDRPRTCRVYDCRVFAATGVVPDQPLVAERATHWAFSRVPDDVPARACSLVARGEDPRRAALSALLDDDPLAGDERRESSEA
jgi:hypothetical protein